MEQLIFVAVIVFFTILEGIARSRKQGGGPAGPLPLPEEREQDERGRPELSRMPRRPEPTRSPTVEPVRTYDQEPSFDDAVEESPASWGGPQGPRAGRRDASGSETLVPQDVWEEIMALARGEKPQGRPMPTSARPRPTPAPPRPPARRPPTPKPAPSRVQVPPEPVHRVHATHPQMGKPMAGRISVLDSAPVRVTTNPDVVAVRRMLAGGPGSLRQAVMLTEVLGPPASVRGGSHDPGG